jgi:hypothetical protein
MSTTFKPYKLTAVPTLPCAPNAIFVVAPQGKPNYIEIYVSNNAGNTLKRLLTDADIQALIDASISGLSGEMPIVDDIAARNALSPTENTQVLVLDATGDATVASGAATYIYRFSTTSWIKLNEAESLDLILQWANIQGRPTSSPSAIDTAVSNSHIHNNNLTQLNKIGENDDGHFTYNSALPKIGWEGPIAW